MAENAGSSYVEALLQDRRWACALARSLVHDEHLADDVVQAAYLASLAHEPPRQVSPRAWFAGVVRNIAKMALRSRARRRTRESAAVRADDGPSAEALFARAEQHRRLSALVLELEEPYRSAVVQRYFGDLEPSAIAARSGEPASTVRSRLKRGLEKLRARLEETDGADWRKMLLPLAAERAFVGAAATAATVGVAKLVAACVFVAAVGVTTWGLMTSRSDAKEAEVSRATQRPSAEEVRAPAPAEAGPVIKPKAFVEAASAAVSGRVVDLAGSPVVGARVIVFPSDIGQTISAAKPEEPGSAARFGLTDAFGRFEVVPVRPSGVVNVCAEHRGLSPAVRESRRPSDEIVVVMEPGRAIAGRVTDGADVPVAGARIRWHAVICGVSFVREASTAEDGSYELADILGESQGLETSQPPTAEVVVTANGYATSYLVPPAADETGRIRLDVVLTQATSLSGVVVDAATLAPIPGAKVAFWTQREHATVPGPAGRLLADPMPVKGLSETTTDSAGRFRLDQLTTQGRAGEGRAAGAGTFGIVGAIAPGYAAALQAVSIGPKGGTPEVVLSCQAGARIQGQLVDGSGRALADVPVWLEPRVGSRHVLPAVLATERGATVTGSDGRFAFDGVRCSRGDSVRLDLVARPAGTLGTPFRRGGIVVRPGETADLGQVFVGSAARLDVLVTDDGGAPVFGARVSLSASLDREDLESQSVATDAQGRATILRFESAPGAGRRIVRVFAQHPGYARGSAFTTNEQSGHDLRITLPLERILRGRVYDDRGAPVVGAQVWLVDARAPRDHAVAWASELDTLPPELLPPKYAAVTTTRAGGTFLLSGLAVTRFHLAARRVEGWTRESTVLYDLEIDGTELIVKLPPAEVASSTGDLEVAVSDAVTAHPVIGGKVVAAIPSGPDLVGEHALGVHRFTRLPAGVYTIFVQARGYVEQVVREVEIRPGPVRSLDIRLDRGESISGKVTRADGLPFTDAVVGLVGEDPIVPPVTHPSITHPVGPDGRFVAHGVAPSRDYAVVVIDRGPSGTTVFTPAGRRRIAAPADKKDLAVEVIQGGVTWFTFTGARGDGREDLRGCRLLVVNEAGRTIHERISLDKTITGVSLPPGSYRASLVRGGIKIDEEAFSISAGDSVELKLSLH